MELNTWLTFVKPFFKKKNHYYDLKYVIYFMFYNKSSSSGHKQMSIYLEGGKGCDKVQLNADLGCEYLTDV